MGGRRGALLPCHDCPGATSYGAVVGVVYLDLCYVVVKSFSWCNSQRYVIADEPSARSLLGRSMLVWEARCWEEKTKITQKTQAECLCHGKRAQDTGLPFETPDKGARHCNGGAEGMRGARQQPQRNTLRQRNTGLYLRAVPAKSNGTTRVEWGGPV
jgi:hypothetical protein